MNKKTKTFDCIRMKREIQERIYNQTRGMSFEQRQQYTRDRIRNSRFASFLDRPDNSRS
jgi:hypothetical protein